MDPFALAGIIGVSGLMGYIAAAQKHGKKLRVLQQRLFSMNVESVTRISHAAMATLHEDYGHPVEEARAKLLKRCAALGMRLVSAKEDGSVTPVNIEEKKS